jgi:hypothetical protein
MRPTAIASGVVALGFGALAVHQGLAASSAYSDANGMVEANRNLAAGADQSRYHALVNDGDAATRNMYVSAGAAVLFAGAAGVLGWRSIDHGAPATGALAVHF